MDYMMWNIIEDNFKPEMLEENRRRYIIVYCKVLYDGEMFDWSLNLDEYMYRKLYIDLTTNFKTMTEEKLKETTDQMIEFFNEIKDREQAEKDAGEDI